MPANRWRPICPFTPTSARTIPALAISTPAAPITSGPAASGRGRSGWPTKPPGRKNSRPPPSFRWTALRTALPARWKWITTIWVFCTAPPAWQHGSWWAAKRAKTPPLPPPPGGNVRGGSKGPGRRPMASARVLRAMSSPHHGGEVVLRRLRPADQRHRAVLPQQQLR